MIQLKPGDFFKAGGKTYWVCNCSDSPLCYSNQSECNWCGMVRPSPRIDIDDNSAEQVRIENELSESGHAPS